MSDKWKIENSSDMEGALKWLGRRSGAKVLVGISPTYASIFRGDGTGVREAIKCIESLLDSLRKMEEEL